LAWGNTVSLSGKLGPIHANSQIRRAGERAKIFVFTPIDLIYSTTAADIICATSAFASFQARHDVGRASDDREMARPMPVAQQVVRPDRRMSAMTKEKMIAA